MTRIEKLLDIHKQNGWTEFIFTSTGIPIPFNSNWKRIAFFISGGADSAMLCWTVLNYLKQNNISMDIHTISHVRLWKTRPWQRPIRENVVNKLKGMFPMFTFSQHTNYIPPEIEFGAVGAIIPHDGRMRSGDQIESSSWAEYLSIVNKFDAVYCGTTANPDELSDTIYKGTPNRNVASAPIVYEYMVYGKAPTKTIRPFFFITKDLTLKNYFLNNITELLNITRSCECDSREILYKLSKEQGINNDMVKQKYYDAWKYYKEGDLIPVCNTECFWCFEKNWAMDKIRKELDV